MDYCNYVIPSSLGKRTADDSLIDVPDGYDIGPRARVKGRRTAVNQCDNNVFAIYSVDNSSDPCSIPMEMVNDRKVLSLTWEQFQKLDKKLFSGMCVRIIA